VVIFQYNPEQLSRSIQPRYAETGGSRTEALRLGGAPSETISATLSLDVADQLEAGDALATEHGLFPQLSALEMLVYPKSALVITNTVLLAAGTIEVVPPVGPLTLFVYGWKRVVPVKLTSLSISETAHDPKLNPIRATADVSLQVLTYSDLSLTHPGYWTFLAHQVVKETMATIGSISNVGEIFGGDVDLFSLTGS
jgi:hypothetical protein